MGRGCVIIRIIPKFVCAAGVHILYYRPCGRFLFAGRRLGDGRFKIKNIIAIMFICAIGLGVPVNGQAGAAQVDAAGAKVMDKAAGTDSIRSVKAAAPGVPEVDDTAHHGGDIDSAAIESLFGAFRPDTAKDSVRVLPPFVGSYRVLVARPTYALYDDDEAGTEWISAAAEVYVCYKVGSFPRTYVFTAEDVDYVLPGSRSYGRIQSRQPVVDAGRRLGATHIIFQEYQPQKDDRGMRHVMELYWIAEDTAVARPSGAVAYSSFERGLDSLLLHIAAAMGSEAGNTAAFRQTVWGGDRGVIEEFGDILAEEYEFTKERSAAVYSGAGGIIRRNSGLVGVQYAAAQLAGRAGEYRPAIDHINEVIAKSGNYPALQLRKAGYLRGAGRYPDAARVVRSAAIDSALKSPVAMEMALIRQAQGDIEGARAEYDSVISNVEGNGITFFRAALLALQSDDTAGCEAYIRRASERGFTFSANEYYALGAAYAALNGYGEAALKYFSMSLGSSHDERAWLAIAEICKRLGDREREAGIYVQLFNNNMDAHSGLLKLAAGIYESIGRADKAKEAYILFLDRGFSDMEVSMSLARILAVQRECQQLRDILSPFRDDPAIAQIFSDCGFKMFGVLSDGQKTSPGVLAMRISGGVSAVAGILVGVNFDRYVKSEARRYRDFGDPLYPKGTDAEYYGKVQDIRKNIDGYKLYRNLLYGLAGAGAGLFTASFYF